MFSLVRSASRGFGGQRRSQRNLRGDHARATLYRYATSRQRTRGMTKPTHLAPEDVEAIAQRVAEILDSRPQRSLVDASELARELGVEREWVYANAERLGAMRLGTVGDRRKPRLRFDLERARARLAQLGEHDPGPPPDKPRRRGRPRRGDRPDGVRLIQGRGSRRAETMR